MDALINVCFPVFAIILSGWLAGRLGILGQDSTAALNGFVYYVSLPALFLASTSQTPVGEVLDPRFLAVVASGYILTALPAAVIARLFFTKRPGEIGLHCGAAVFANTGYMGIPLMLTAFGDAATIPTIATTLANVFLVLGLATAILEVDGRESFGPRVIGVAVLGVARSPLLIACVFGLLLSSVDVSLPTPVMNFLTLIGAAAGPCALFAMGLFLVGQSIRGGAAELSWLTVAKLVIHPLLTWLVARYLIPLDPLEEAVAVVMAALPTGGLIFVLAQRYNVYVRRATTAILVSTIVSVATVTLSLQYYSDLIVP